MAGVKLGAEGWLKVAESLRVLTMLRSLSLSSTTFFVASQMEGIVRPCAGEVFIWVQDYNNYSK